MSIFRIVMSDSISMMSSTNVWTSEETDPAVGRCPESAISNDELRRSWYYLVNQLLQSPTLRRKRLLAGNGAALKRAGAEFVASCRVSRNGLDNLDSGNRLRRMVDPI